MCYLCDDFGDGGIWYLNPKNYARYMYKLRLSGEGFKGADAGPETGARTVPTIRDLVNAAENGDRAEYDRISQAISNVRGDGQEGQVIPLKDADKVMDLCSPIGIMSCVCRKGVRAVDERSEHDYTCMGMGTGMLKWERWPERYKGGVRFLTPDEGREWNREMDRRGFCHLLMIFEPPFIGGFCQCDYPDCGLMKSAVDYGVGALLKSHYVAQVDYGRCNGCGICVQRCQWGALKFEVTIGKANINQLNCYGCGLCETGCPTRAISLIDRTSLPGLADVWK